MTHSIDDPGHGHSPAAWSAVLIMLLGLSVAAVALFLWIPWLLIASAVVFLIGPIVGFILTKAGYGAGGPKSQPKAH